MIRRQFIAQWGLSEVKCVRYYRGPDVQIKTQGLGPTPSASYQIRQDGHAAISRLCMPETSVGG